MSIGYNNFCQHGTITLLLVYSSTLTPECSFVFCNAVLALIYSEGYGSFCQAVKMLFLEIVSVLCFGQGSYEPPTPELIELLIKQIFQEQQVTRSLTPLAWEETDSNPVVRSVLLQLILMGRCVDYTVSLFGPFGHLQ